MPWGKIDDTLDFHPKVMDAGNEAMGLWVRALAYSCRLLTDGFIKDSAVGALQGAEIAQQLVDAGLWIRVDGGYQFKDWDHYQPSAADTKEQRAKVTAARSAAGRRGMQVRWDNKTDNKTHNKPITNVITNAYQTDNPEPEPEPDTTSKDVVGTKRATRIPDIFPITPEMESWAKANVPGMDYKNTTAIFHDYWLAASGTNSRKQDWVRAWQVWMRKDYQRFTPGQKATMVSTPKSYDTPVSELFCKKHTGWPARNCDRCAEEVSV